MEGRREGYGRKDIEARKEGYGRKEGRNPKRFRPPPGVGDSPLYEGRTDGRKEGRKIKEGRKEDQGRKVIRK